MGWLFKENAFWAALSFALGALITWLLLVRKVTVREAIGVDDVRDRGVEEPDFGTPDVRRPDFGEPGFDRADAEAPTLNQPGMDLPSPSAPDVPEVPTVSAPVAGAATAAAGAAGLGAAAVAGGRHRDEPETDASAVDEPEVATTTVDSKVAEEAVPDSQPTSFAAPPAAPYGEGSAEPLEGGAAPHESFTIKGNADSMLYHSPDSPYYGRTIAEVWFDTEQRAEAAGFTRWDRP